MGEYSYKLIDIISSIDMSGFNDELTRNERALLSILYESKQQLTVGEVGAMLKTTKPLTSQIVSRLEKRGLIKRSWFNPDRRKINLYITKKGKEILASSRSQINEFIDQRLANLSNEECQKLIELAEKAFASVKDTSK